MAFESRIVCAARGCQNNGQALRSWLGKVCFEHRPNLKAECSCPPLYDFHELPKDTVDRQMWLKALHLRGGLQRCYVCSAHFADKRPTDTHPYPEFYLGIQKKQFTKPAKETGNLSAKPEANAVKATAKSKCPPE